MKVLILFIFLLCSVSFGKADKNGGMQCAVCTLVVGLGEQLSQVHSDSIVNAIDEHICKNLPKELYKQVCYSLLEQVAPYIIEEVYHNETPDTVCHKAHQCYQEQPGSEVCHVFPLPPSFAPRPQKLKFHPKSRLNMKLRKRSLAKTFGKVRSDPSWCDHPLLQSICDYIDKFADGHFPIKDGDDDGFSLISSFRGDYWRGKDCNDGNGEVYPGRKPLNNDTMFDSNCNGIHGRDLASGESFENLFCNTTNSFGVISLGDSASAHFHIPPAYLEAENIGQDTFKDLGMVVENEFDWPHLSAMTGFMENKWPQLIKGDVRSVYSSMLQMNLCNHRDYQNIAVNGASSGNILGIAKSISRNQKLDYPVILNFALIGNDVCNGHDDTLDHMTDPTDYKRNMIEVLDYLDTVLPNGSYVMMSGLADGTILWDTMHDRIHPVGKLNADVRYADIYEWLKCLGLTPCAGWMNKNETVRQLTTKRAMELSDAGKEIVSSKKYKNFKMMHYDYDVAELIKRWEALGGQDYEIIDPVDGFHPNQNAQYMSAPYLLEQLERAFPQIFHNKNPHNDNIRKVFGDQGGYF